MDYHTHKKDKDRKTRKYERRKAWDHNKSLHSSTAKRERRANSQK